MFGNSWFKKEMPLLGLTGAGGGVGSNLVASLETPLEVSYLVIGGGGGGGRGRGGGGGAGGYRTNYASETPGGPGTSTEPTLEIVLGQNYPVLIGAGGAAGPANDTRGGRGGPSKFATIECLGGGPGGAAFQPVSRQIHAYPQCGGSGGGGAGQVTGSPITHHGMGGFATGPTGTPGDGGGPRPVQGYRGGDAVPGGGNDGAGGGGAGAQGVDGQGTAGGVGKSSSITGSPVFRAAGGGGGGDDASGPGGNGGGGNGSTGSGTPGSAHTGSGGGGGLYTAVQGYGGTGVVIVRYSKDLTIANPGGGLTLSTATDGSSRVTTITHPGSTSVAPVGNPDNSQASGNISWS